MKIRKYVKKDGSEVLQIATFFYKTREGLEISSSESVNRAQMGFVSERLEWNDIPTIYEENIKGAE